MTHPVGFKFLLLLTFAVWIHQSETHAIISNHLNDCCIFGINHVPKSCNYHQYNYTTIPSHLHEKCQLTIISCCIRQREIVECKKGKEAARNGTDCENRSKTFMMCCRSCKVGLKIASTGSKFYENVKGESTYEQEARKECYNDELKFRLLEDNEVVLNSYEYQDPEEDEDDMAEYDDSGQKDGSFEESKDEENEGLRLSDDDYEAETTMMSTTTEGYYSRPKLSEESIISKEVSASSEDLKEISKSIEQEVESKSSNEKSSQASSSVKDLSSENKLDVEYDSDQDSDSKLKSSEITTTTKITTTESTSSEELTTIKTTTKESDTEATTTFRSRHDSTIEPNEITTTIRPVIHIIEPKHKKVKSLFEHTLSSGSRVPPVYRFKTLPKLPTTPKYYEFQINTEKILEPCGDINACEHSCIIDSGVQRCTCNNGYRLNWDRRTCRRIHGASLPPEEIRTTVSCKPGYYKNDFGYCEDIDECKIENNGCGDKSVCENILGSYKCLPKEICKTGFRFNEKRRTCEDIDECFENPKTCKDDQTCNNTHGSYVCAERYEYLINRVCDSHDFAYKTTTAKAPRPIFDIPISRRPSIYYSSPNPLFFKPTTSVPRKCPQGFEMDASGKCVDIDECTRSSTNPCSPGKICDNYNGGYNCIKSNCDPGFKPDGARCIDINECERNPCPLTHDCHNNIGSYQCRVKTCERGFKLNSFGQCEDINECVIYRNLCRNGECLNTHGSYLCECNSGFKRIEHNVCRDIDECTENTHNCDHQCYNTFGSYKCSCKHGYKLNSWNNQTCDDINECQEFGMNPCRGECENTDGGFECKCPGGFRREGELCIDIDECVEYPDICNSKTHQCLNLVGSHKCMDLRCTSDYKLVRRQKLRYCQLKTPCGDDDYDEICNQPWSYMYNFVSRTANSTGMNLLQFNINSQIGYKAEIGDFRVIGIGENVKKAEKSDFSILKTETAIFLKVDDKLDGPQEIEIDIIMTMLGYDDHNENKRAHKVVIIISEHMYSSFHLKALNFSYNN